MAAASSLGVRCGRTISFLNAEETESRLGRRITTDARPLHHLKPNLKPNSKQQTNNNKKKKKQMMIISQGACLISNNLSRAAVINSSSSSSSSSPLHLDPIFKRGNAKMENNVGGVGGEQRQRQAPPAPPISAEKLDEWINYSVSEIVRNIEETPLLVQVYSKNNKGGSSVGSSSSPTTVPIPLFERSKAEPESWAGIRRSWEEGSPVPDGIILVEELNVNDNDTEEKEEPTSNNAYNSSTKTWGVVIQGRGADSASSCYILKTCRVGSPFGFCTHFCLVRAKCFGEIADLQLKNSWLLN